MNVVVFDPYADKAFAAQHNIPLVEFEDLLKQSDFVTLHMPMLAGTKHLINAKTIELMKKNAYLINTARGGVINEADLFEALKAKRIAGAGLDVFDEEPPGDHPFFTLDNVVMTAHTAGVDVQSRDDMARVAAQAIVRLLSGDWPEGWVVNPTVASRWRK